MSRQPCVCPTQHDCHEGHGPLVPRDPPPPPNPDRTQEAR